MGLVSEPSGGRKASKAGLFLAEGPGRLAHDVGWPGNLLVW